MAMAKKMKKDNMYAVFYFLLVFYPISYVLATMIALINLLLGMSMIILLQTFWTIITVDYLLRLNGKKGL